ncbi:MAG: hypothetical protein KY428_05825 [Bacteroidetes bacterium]|nr:hypothetical protein [Bacteroidota bacterium]
MKQLEVPFLQNLDSSTPIEKIADSLNGLQKYAIDMAPWRDFGYKPEVSFALAHSNDCLFLKFFVTESFLRATYCNTNDPVYKDSCVEFFIAFNGEAEYYNFEFNCLGTCLAGYGTMQNNRRLLPEAVIANIKSLATIKRENTNTKTLFSWQLSLLIPIKTFCMHALTGLKEAKSSVNFFKCGDDLPNPHYLSWNAIEATEPNFHLPQFFGEMDLL